MLVACQSLPGFSRSGEVRAITIGNQLSIAAIEAAEGDEIRWTNTLMTPVRIVVLDYVLNRLSCRSNFSGHFYSGAEVTLQPDESAGLCFRNPGTIRYVVRRPSDLRNNGETAELGHIHIQTLSEHPTTEQNAAAAAPP